MKAFRVSELEAGHYFTKEVYLDEKFILLTPETPLTESLIDRLRSCEYEQVHSDGETVSKPIASSDDGSPPLSLSVDQDVKEQAQREADLMMREAQAAAEKHTDDARGQIAALMREIEALDRSRRAYLAQIRHLAERHIAEADAAMQQRTPGAERHG